MASWIAPMVAMPAAEMLTSNRSEYGVVYFERHIVLNRSCHFNFCIAAGVYGAVHCYRNIAPVVCPRYSVKSFVGVF